MSFILDALRKSESERQRQSGPALFEVKVAPPRNRFAGWAVALGALLAINLVVVGWLLWRGSSRPASASQVASLTAHTPPSGLPAPAPTVAATAAPTTSPEASAPAGPAAPVSAPQTPASPQGAAAPSGAATAGEGDSGVTPDDLAPAVEPSRHASQPVDGVIRSTPSGLPTYQDASAAPGANIPQLRLDLHVYSPQPDQRFVFVNMTKLHEGDSLPQGVRVDSITPDGVILSYRGRQFVLQRQ
jgi:general secretion pathway protein B